MTRDDIIRMARKCEDVPLDDSNTNIWVFFTEQLEHFAALVSAAEREKVAAWMIERDYATGHGDTIEGLLKALEWQAKERARGFL
jgi:hypothetical protein